MSNFEFYKSLFIVFMCVVVSISINAWFIWQLYR